MRLNKKGSIYIEATMVMPLTCFIVIAMIVISVGFFNRFTEQLNLHKNELEKGNMVEGDYIWEIVDIGWY